MGETTKKRPFGFYVCNMTFTFERMAYYTAKWLIAIFVVKSIAEGGLGMNPADGAKMSANLVAFTYLTPVIGGWLCDHYLSPRLAVPVGAILMGAGYFVGWQTNSIGMCWLMIALVSIGTGLFKGNVSGVNGRLFNDPDELDAAFSIQYSFVNIGSFIGTTFIVLIASTYSYRATFLVCGIIMVIDALWWIIMGKKYLGEVGKKPFKIDSRKEEKKEKAEETKPLTGIEKKRIAAILIVTLFSVIFWTVWYLAYMPVYYYWGPDGAEGACNFANWSIGNFQIPTAWFDSVNALCCIVLGPVLAVVWNKLASRPQGDMSMFKKTALGMGLLGISFVYMSVLDILRGDGQVNVLFIALFGVILSLGEMVFSPLGNSFINKFSPARTLGLLLGVWPFAIFFAGKAYGYLYEFLTKFKFAPAYAVTGAIVLVCGVVLWAMDKRLNSLVED
ncbi:peptide MFS transporter [Lachnospiraceae bacterium LCP25S3_G4]